MERSIKDRKRLPVAESRNLPTLSVTVFHPMSHIVVVKVRGSVDLTTSDLLKDAVKEAISSASSSNVIVDLREVEFMGGVAVGILAWGASFQDGRRRFFLVVDGNRAASRPLELTGVGDSIELFDDLDTAIRSCGAGSAH